MRIGLLSDTHSFLDEAVFDYFANCDEVWHAGDFGAIEVAEKLKNFKPLRGVHGNIDGQDIRAEFPLHLRFRCEEMDVWMTHIGGYPGNYNPKIKKEIRSNPPQLFICGHSHILKVIPDKTLNLLHINPGAAGKEGFHKIRTIVRFSITGNSIQGLEVIELGGRGQ